MKKVIFGKVYDTDTSVCVGEIEHGYMDDLNYICMSSFRYRNGRKG